MKKEAIVSTLKQKHGESGQRPEYKKDKGVRGAQNSQKMLNAQKSKCPRCNLLHGRNCPAIGTKCQNCGKMNHWKSNSSSN